ncbi:MAG: DUF3619 family protein [Rubrivivax sp.]
MNAAADPPLSTRLSSGFAAEAAAQADVRDLEARMGSRIAAALSIHAEQLPADIVERLRFGRSQALERARMARMVGLSRATAGAKGTVVVGRTPAGAAVQAGFVPMWQRVAGMFPLLMLVAGLVAIDSWSVREQVIAVADVDAQLLADQLPPSAYSDPGFAAYLRSAPLP